MKAILCDSAGAEEVMRLGETHAADLGEHDLRIRVRATSVNRADLLQRQGMYPPPPGASEILGLECAGDVVEVGAAVKHWKIGERAMALLPGGGYAQEAVVHHGAAMRIPAALSYEEAGALPEVFLTAYLNLFMLGGAADKKTALVQGGGSGVGTAATTLLKLAGLRVIVTAGSDEKCARCLEHGADVALNYRAGEFVDAVRAATGGKGAEVILDHVGGKYLTQNLQSLAVDGRLVIIGLIGGAKAEVNLALLLTRRLGIFGSTLRTRSDADKAEIVAGFLRRFGADLEAGRIRPVIDRVLPLAGAPEAHRIVQRSEHFGKVVLRVD